MHNIYAEKFYAHREPAWHKLGLVSSVPMTAWEAGARLGLPRVYTEPIKTVSGLVIPNYKAICGEELDATSVSHVTVYSVVSEEYKAITHGDFVRSWDRATSNAPIETLGLLGNGSTLFVLARLPGFDVKGVEHSNYLLAVNPLTGFEAEYGRVTPVRVVCQNTLNLSGGRFVQEFRARHVGNVLNNLDEWLSEMWESARFKSEALTEAFSALASRRVNETEARSVIASAYPLPVLSEVDLKTEEKKAEWAAASERQLEHCHKAYNLYEGLGDGSTLVDVAGTAYGAYNAVVEYEQHGKKYGKQTSAFLGAGAKRTGAALDAVLALVQ